MLEDVLAKLGLGELTPGYRMDLDTATPRLHFFNNESAEAAPWAEGTLFELVSDRDLLMTFHMVFIPCSGSLNVKALLDPGVQQNLRAYVEAGGKIYVSDWSGEWADNIFPAFLELENDTPAEAYDWSSGTYDVALFGNADGAGVDWDLQAYAEPGVSYDWLHEQFGPQPEGIDGVIDGASFRAVPVWTDIYSVSEAQSGIDASGEPVYSTPEVHFTGVDTEQPLLTSFEPLGCGRITYASFHSVGPAHAGLMAQERAVLYTLMELGECTAPSSL